jgi:hypothetical protein
MSNKPKKTTPESELETFFSPDIGEVQATGIEDARELVETKLKEADEARGNK